MKGWKKIRKNSQISFINLKGAGRKPVHDKGSRHIARPKFYQATSLHLTIKVCPNKADIQNKMILKALHHAIMRARLKGLRVIHYTLEYNHLHLLVESNSHTILSKGMQAFGITLAKAINRIKKTKGQVYKYRYHFRKITSPRDLKNVLHYIFHNGVKHKRTKSLIDPFNSLVAEPKLNFLYPREAKSIWADITNSQFLKSLQRELHFVLVPGEVYFKALIVTLAKG